VTNWKDIDPRLGVSYDLFGNGKTAIKATVGRYLQGETIQFAAAMNPVNTAVNSVNRTWGDSNNNFYPDCDFFNLLQNQECGQASNLNFGKPITTTQFDPDIRDGWGKRGYNWESEVTISHELMSRVSLNAGYYRRTYGNMLAVDNLLVAPTDYTFYDYPMPADSRLPPDRRPPSLDWRTSIRTSSEDQQQRHIRQQLRSAVRPLQRRRHQHQRAAAARGPAARRRVGGA
jgi:hypothetical protein